MLYCTRFDDDVGWDVDFKLDENEDVPDFLVPYFEDGEDGEGEDVDDDDDDGEVEDFPSSLNGRQILHLMQKNATVRSGGGGKKQ